jgi:hypothetical protein
MPSWACVASLASGWAFGWCWLVYDAWAWILGVWRVSFRKWWEFDRRWIPGMTRLEAPAALSGRASTTQREVGEGTGEALARHERNKRRTREVRALKPAMMSDV